jgi:hypothetical protein
MRGDDEHPVLSLYLYRVALGDVVPPTLSHHLYPDHEAC